MNRVHIEYDLSVESDNQEHLNKVALVFQLDQDMLLPEDRDIIFKENCVSIRACINDTDHVYPKIISWDVVNKTATLIITFDEVLPYEQLDVKLHFCCRSDEYVDTLLCRKRFIKI